MKKISNNKLILKVAAAALLLAAWVSAPFFTGNVKADGTPVILTRTAVLTPAAGSDPHGSAEWQLYQSGNRELEVEIEDVNLGQGTALDVFIDGTAAGQMIVDERQRGRLRLRTEHGEPVPVVNDGSVAEVRNGAAVLVSGVFGGGGTPSPTVTVTGTPSPSQSGTSTPSPSQTGTSTPSPSQTGTSTPSPSQTGTFTPSPSQTGTETPSPSQTGTSTPSPSPTGGLVVRTAVLHSVSGFNPHGDAVWQLEGNQRELEVELEDISLPMGTVLDVFIDGNAIGQMTVDDRQKATLRLNTRNGQNVPFVNDGSTIEVRNGGTLLASGVFGAGPTPTVTATGTPSVTPSISPTGTPSGTPSVSPTGTPHENELFAALTGDTINGVMPIGIAEYEVHSSRTELEVHVRQVNLGIGTVLTVVVDGNAVGTFTLRSGGEGELRLRSDNGQNVPVIMVGSAISVNQGNTVILSGAFGATGTPSPSPSGTGTGTPSPSPSQTPFGRSFEAHLNGSNMVPPVSTAARGEVKVLLSSDGTQATVFGEFHNLTSNQTGARIETLTGTPELVFNLGVVGGVNGHFAQMSFAVTPDQVQQLRSGLWSAVIASVNNPNGEIRGTLIHHSRRSDFDGDGSHDLALFRPTAGTWYIQNSAGFSSIAFGSSSDKLVSGDYDGDGRTDAAVYRNMNGLGVWDINRSSDNGTTRVQYGLATDVAVRADFDGDGRFDLAVYRPSEGIWYIRDSSTGIDRTVRFGIAEDIPMPADVDGDGRDNVVVFRPSQGMWYWMRGNDLARFGAMNFGLATDIPVRGDFDGDGKADLSVYRPSNGVWYALRSSDGRVQAVQFGTSEDIPVAGNYDGDGQTDIAVFRPSDGNWYVLRSSDNSLQATHFGNTGDIPAIAR